jgi:hypothetical protein
MANDNKLELVVEVGVKKETRELKLAGGCALLVLAARMNFQYALKRRQD